MRKKKVRAHVVYSGRVQGIGFRYTAERLALGHGLVGWVKNLPDGRVEVVCEAPQGTIDLFLEDIQKSPLGAYIKKTDCTWEKPTNKFTDFCIEFCH